jgi:hypothetical protein
MLGKCLWKMYHKSGEEYDPAVQATKPSLDSVLAAFVKAIKTAPKPRDGRQEPILEPHYKLVSIVHKLVLMGTLQAQVAADLLQQQPYAYAKGEAVVINSPAEWEPFMLKTMKHLRNADKQHWHHRMVARVAGIIYDEEQPDYDQAVAARHEFRESIFTKTMHIQVWKPDAERAGRHCVYMERYVRYICKVLLVLNDKANMDALAKRVRKKQNEFFQFQIVWNEVCTAYLRLIRRKAEIPPNMDEVFKGVPIEEFEILSARLADWVANPTMEHPALEALRDSLELKKLNTGQMKPGPIDDLINDSFAVLYTQIAKDLPGPDPSLTRAQVDGESGISPSRPMGPMSLNNLVMDMGNGTQIPVPVTFAGSEPSRTRRVGISRRDVIRRAELAVARMPETPRAIASSSARPQATQSSTVIESNAAADLEDVDTPNGNQDESTMQEAEELDQENELSNDNEQADDAEDEGADEQEQDDLDEQLNNGANNKEPSESARGSLHDSADDESDLSDVPDMEDIDESGIFPDLVRPRIDNHEDDHEEGDDGSEDEDEEEEDEEQDEDGEEGEEAEEEEQEVDEGDEMETEG